MVNVEEYINQQVGRKLLEYEDDLNKKKGNHHLERFSWVVIGCFWVYIIIQMVRWKIG
jgi:hypothetical protein